MEEKSGANGVDGDAEERGKVEALDLDLNAQGGGVALKAAKLAVAPVIIGVLR